LERRAVGVVGGTGLPINHSDPEEGSTANHNGIVFMTVFAPVACETCAVSSNRIKGFGGNGIVAETKDPAPGPGTLLESSTPGNDVEDNGNDGILIAQGASLENPVTDNVAQGNHTDDCEDSTYLIAPGLHGTAGRFNMSFNDVGSLSDPVGLCSPPGTY
jgi:hypothetical protein